MGERSRRTPLTRARVLAAAVALADADGAGAVTMRALARGLGVKPMALYHHVAGKEEILDGMVDAVFAEIALPDEGLNWQTALRERASSTRAALRRHPWATPLMESRTAPGPATLRHHEAVIATLRRAGFSIPLTAHAVAVLDAYVYGFALSESSLPFEGPEDVGELAEAILTTLPAEEYPAFIEFATEHVLQPGYDYGEEFGFGLELILEGLERHLGS
jgi:AcrR family transcriptional regulator